MAGAGDEVQLVPKIVVALTRQLMNEQCDKAKARNDFVSTDSGPGPALAFTLSIYRLSRFGRRLFLP